MTVITHSVYDESTSSRVDDVFTFQKELLTDPPGVSYNCIKYEKNKSR